MTNRITSKILEGLASDVAEATGMDISIDYSSDYGGYRITTNKQSTILMHRSTAKETKSFLQGIQAGIYLKLKEKV